ncbi:MAG: zf-HC2 domain-containing protein [Planctomycetes bacterium]|nr:zf-HC2 domain-containing protein [Planctomycetota bacterium]
MNCEQAREALGPYVDEELGGTERDSLEAHLATCGACRAELENLGDMAAGFHKSESAPVPDVLWNSIERRLGTERQSLTGARSEIGKAAAVRPPWLGRLPLALAAAIVLAIGLSIFEPTWTDSTARASSVDFSALLNALPVDAKEAFTKFLVMYHAREGSVAKAKRYAPDLNFDLPEVLPGGFRLQSVHLLRIGELAGVAAMYDRDGEFLGAVFHRPVDKENFGPHRDYPCTVGRHEGHQVSVGEWKLVHLMDPTTCHCVLSKLDERTELPGVMAAVAPGLPEGTGGHGH